jgi:hypothetical protein
MNRTFLVIAIVCTLGLATLNAQQPQQQVVASTPNASVPDATTHTNQTPVAELEFSEVVYRVTADGKLVPLEKQQSTIVNKKNAFSSERFISIKGEKSPTRIVSSLTLVVKLPGLGEGDPSSRIRVDKLIVDPKGGVRKIPIEKIGGLGVGKPVADTTIGELSFSREGNHIKISSALPLSAGEYAISTGGTYGIYQGTLFLFGVDEQVK